jgi:hypothetical protein
MTLYALYTNGDGLENHYRKMDIGSTTVSVIDKYHTRVRV